MRKLGGTLEKYAWKRMQSNFLYAKRLEQGLTIRGAAKKCGIHWTTFEKAENGYAISNTVARKIGTAMGLTDENAVRLTMGLLPSEGKMND